VKGYKIDPHSPAIPRKNWRSAVGILHRNNIFTVARQRPATAGWRKSHTVLLRQVPIRLIFEMAYRELCDLRIVSDNSATRLEMSRTVILRLSIHHFAAVSPRHS